RLEELGGIQWPCNDAFPHGAQVLHGRLWDDVVADRAPVMPGEDDPPVDKLDAEVPIPLTTRPPLEALHTGGPTRRVSPQLHPADGARLGVDDGERVRIVSRRGAVEAPVRYDDTLRPGLAFMSFHFPELVETNVLTIDATDPKSGTAEFKASAIRIERLEA